MTDGDTLYRLMSWLSPGYPVGAFSYSHGLEQAVEAGLVADETDLVDWVATVLLQGTGRVDGLLFREAWTAVGDGDWDRLAEIAETGHAFQGTAEFALETRAQGEAFVRTTAAIWPAPALDRIAGGAVYPVAVAVACAAHGIPLEPALRAYFHGFASNLVSAGVRLVPLGQTSGQRAVAALAAPVAAALAQSLRLDFDDIGSAAPLLDLLSMTHETQYTRLFRS
ncbi:MAG: urease accessory protein UreF [Rhodospirillaceae bacterium]